MPNRAERKVSEHMNEGWRPEEPVWFMLGELRCAVVSAGQIDAGPLRETVTESGLALLSPAEQDSHLILDINLLVVEIDGARVLFDAGAGTAADLGLALFGDSVANPPDVLEQAGIDPSSIDAIALTHAHPDHAWGLIDESGAALFPSAQLIIGRKELAHWTSDDQVPAETNEPMRVIHHGARRSIKAYEDRLIVVSGGRQLLSAVTVYEAAGHSPGHLVYEIRAPRADRSFFFWGDICHHPVALEHPDLNFVFDHDPAMALESRRRLLGLLASADADILSYHFPFPGLGRLTGSAEAGYRWTAIAR
jgi:glyoxylase-like metal-dependent hydrolase (beta-lactamase superfamily II)